MSSGKTVEALTQENQELRRQLEIAQKWMRRQIEESVHKIATRMVGKMTETIRDDFLRENQEQIITKRIHDYFGDILLLNAPSGMIDYLVAAEINFFNLQKTPSLDGFTVIGSYHKILDTLIESIVTNGYRKFAVKHGCTILRVNDPLEKSLHQIVNKKYILSVGRLYGLLKMLQENEKLSDYGRVFAEYLEKHGSLRDILLGESFYPLFEKAVKSEIFGSKRHEGTITLEETKQVREWMIGDFKEKRSILYVLLESQAILW